MQYIPVRSHLDPLVTTERLLMEDPLERPGEPTVMLLLPPPSKRLEHISKYCTGKHEKQIRN
jgi:hypothetical protein